MNQPLPTNWIGLVAIALIVGIPALLAAWQSRRNRVRIGDVQGGVDNITEQVTNGHHTNLRDDITDLIKQGAENARMTAIVKKYVETKMPDSNALLKLHEAVEGVSDDVRSLRGELADERQARTELDERVRAHHAQHHQLPGE